MMRKWKVRRDEFGRWVAVQPDGTEWIVNAKSWRRTFDHAYDHGTAAISEVP